MYRTDPHLLVYRQNAPRLPICRRCRRNEYTLSYDAALYPAKVRDAMAVALFITEHLAVDKFAGQALRISYRSFARL